MFIRGPQKIVCGCCSGRVCGSFDEARAGALGNRVWIENELIRIYEQITDKG